VRVRSPFGVAKVRTWGMTVHHVAFATRNLEATHAFYNDIMGFDLVKTVVGPTENEGGWARHVFYDTGGSGMIAFWDLHDDALGEFDTAVSTGLGLPVWVNHLAFDAADADELVDRREAWLDAGQDVMEVDHGFCRSVYTVDPNGILVEWCTDTRPLDDEDRRQALEALTADRPPVENAPVPVFHRARS
jgi:catechol 2,3-dioxygenase-like lactoylglutathione lyase family enzyme